MFLCKLEIFPIIIKQQMSSNKLTSPIVSPDKQVFFKHSFRQKHFVIPRNASFQKNKISSPPHQSHLTPPKVPNLPQNEVTHPLYAYQSFGSKSCTKVNKGAFRLDVANQEDKKSNHSHDKKRMHMKIPNFLLSLSEMNNKKTSKKKEDKNLNFNEIVTINKKITQQKTQSKFAERINKYTIADIPKIDFLSKTNESSIGKKSHPYPRSEADKSSASIGKSKPKDQHINNLIVPVQSRQKARSLQKNQVQKQAKIPSFIRLKQEQIIQAKNYFSKLQNNPKSPTQTNIYSQIQQIVNFGQEFKINIKPAVKKRGFQDFIIIKQLGKGSYGRACLAIEKKIGFVCVIKVIQKNLVNEYQIKILMRQIKIQSFLDHIHITSLYGFFDDQQNVYLIMELLPTGNLKGLIKSKTLTQKSISNIIFQILSAIDYMHSNRIIHRDIKPENIFTFDNYMRLGDFGCAVYCDQIRRSLVGSPCYLSPQQLRNEDYDEKVDVWEIGILTYELYYKVSPFEKDIIAIIQGARSAGQLSMLWFPPGIPISEETKDFIQKTLKKHPHERISIKEALRHPFIKHQGQEFDMLRSCHV